MPINPPASAAPRPAASAGGQKALAGLLGLVVGLVVGYGAGRVSTGTPVNPFDLKGGYDKGYSEGYAAAKQKLVESGFLPAALAETKSLVGTVVSVSGDSLVIETGQRPANSPETTGPPIQRTVQIADATAIYGPGPKTAEERQAGLEGEEGAAPAAAPAPEPFERVRLSLKDLKTGMTVYVTADHDILLEASFTATEVAVQETPAPTRSVVKPVDAPPPSSP